VSTIHCQAFEDNNSALLLANSQHLTSQLLRARRARI
jgi:hypothetical protein